jgi:hypothetical protein
MLVHQHCKLAWWPEPVAGSMFGGRRCASLTEEMVGDKCSMCLGGHSNTMQCHQLLVQLMQRHCTGMPQWLGCGLAVATDR